MTSKMHSRLLYVNWLYVNWLYVDWVTLCKLALCSEYILSCIFLDKNVVFWTTLPNPLASGNPYYNVNANFK